VCVPVWPFVMLYRPPIYTGDQPARPFIRGGGKWLNRLVFPQSAWPLVDTSLPLDGMVSLGLVTTGDGYSDVGREFPVSMAMGLVMPGRGSIQFCSVQIPIVMC